MESIFTVPTCHHLIKVLISIMVWSWNTGQTETLTVLLMQIVTQHDENWLFNCRVRKEETSEVWTAGGQNKLMGLEACFLQCICQSCISSVLVLIGQLILLCVLFSGNTLVVRVTSVKLLSDQSWWKRLRTVLLWSDHFNTNSSLSPSSLDNLELKVEKSLLWKALQINNHLLLVENYRSFLKHYWQKHS